MKYDMKIILFPYRVTRYLFWVFVDFFRPKSMTFRNVKLLSLNFLVPLNEDIGWQIYTRREYEKPELNALNELVQDNFFCVDVGGNIGVYAVYLAHNVPKGKVYCFEPQPLYSSIIKLNANLNNLQNILIEEMVLSDKEGEIEFSVSVDSAYSSINPTGRKKQKKTILVKSSTIDELFFAKGIKVDFLKIDVEGAEFLVLKGSKNLLSSKALRPNYVLVELNEINQCAYGIEPKQIIDFMSEHGYECYSILSNKIAKGWPQKNSSEDVLFKFST